MADQIQKDKAPFKSPQWLLEVTKKRSDVPSKALLERLQYTREHPYEDAKKLREDAIQSGRDPDAFAKMMAEMRKNAQPVRLAQRPNHVCTAATAEEINSAVKSLDHIRAERDKAQTDTPRLAAALAPMGPVSRSRSANSPAWTATQSTEWSAWHSTRRQRRLGGHGEIVKPTQPQSRGVRDIDMDKVRGKTTKSGSTRSAGGTASSINVDNPESLVDSSASDAVREALNATSRTLEDPNLSIMRPVAESYPFPTRPAMPTWYTSVSQKSQMQLDRRRPPEITAIDALKACITRCIGETHQDRLTKEYNDLRNHVHKAEIKLEMDKVKVKKTRILLATGLPRIFDEHANFPWDLKADAWNLYERWMNEDFEQDILRGIVTVKGKNRNGDRLDRAYTEKYPKDPKHFGDNGAILGQWWPSQLCAVRDGVHGAAQGGIYGDKDRGTYSIVLSSGGYQDRDDGDVIDYSGTSGSNFEIKAATQSMITSSTLGNQVRVLRSFQLPKSNKYRPSCGLRYDGLYQIKSYRGIDREKQTYRFYLERIPGQEPIRFEGVTKRPTVFEEEAYQRCKGRI